MREGWECARGKRTRTKTGKRQPIPHVSPRQRQYSADEEHELYGLALERSTSTKGKRKRREQKRRLHTAAVQITEPDLEHEDLRNGEDAAIGNAEGVDVHEDLCRCPVSGREASVMLICRIRRRTRPDARAMPRGAALLVKAAWRVDEEGDNADEILPVGRAASQLHSAMAMSVSASKTRERHEELHKDKSGRAHKKGKEITCNEGFWSFCSSFSGPNRRRQRSTWHGGEPIAIEDLVVNAPV